MKPIAIVQHEADVAPGNLEQHLQARGRSYIIKRLFDGDAMPGSAQPYAGICSLGGSMSVNDQLPWIEAELALLRDADACGVPIIGHCLGGQVLARAFGAVVDRSPHVEIGWSRLQIDDAAFPLFADPARSARQASGWGLGLNWYLTSNFKLVANYTQTTFEGGAAGGLDREDEQAFFSRAQLSF